MDNVVAFDWNLVPDTLMMIVGLCILVIGMAIGIVIFRRLKNSIKR
ncbi:hypothetical protein lbkm_2083 [Lachnospiraceae bacterium KM106-2]|nr:hypothetical protein lbkm_2083 [Lachnospiraceae bacterium KM106-2]